MKQSRVYKLVIVLCFIVHVAVAQVKFSGFVKNKNSGLPMQGVEVYSKSEGKTVFTNSKGTFDITLENKKQELVFIYYGFEIIEISVNPAVSNQVKVALAPLVEALNTVVITQQQNKVFGIKKLKNVEGTAIYAGKKTEVVLAEQLISNKASGNPRQAFAQVAGLNIYETEDAGLQLNIGGRGLDPNRSANFNTRQNGYDISADVLGYPESYYTPSLEALEEIQIVRGAASLQYGTQFGGLVNFKLKQPNPTKKFEWISRTGGGSFGLFNSFNSFSGTIKKASYYTYYQHKRGDGFRPNSNFDSHNLYANLGYQFTDKTKITFESTYLTYVAKQAGGLNDDDFDNNPFSSNRTRNFFKVDWVLLNLKLEHELSSKTKASLNVFTLNASRSAVGFRDRRPATPDNLDNPRELLVDEFNNWGAEARLLTRYSILNKSSVFLIGAKYYQSLNKSQQGIGSNSSNADFGFRDTLFPDSLLPESKFDFPNLNFALFGENIFNINNSFSVTPGFRLEHINTQSDGFFTRKVESNTGRLNFSEDVEESNTNNRTFVILGLGLSYKPSNDFELFGNFSQNYRSVTFNDIRIISPNQSVDPNIADEEGYTGDIGVRGTLSNIFRYDVSIFSLLYDNRIGDTQLSTGRVQRTNIGKAQIFGFESLITANLSNWLLPQNKNFHWQHFLNTAYTTSEYTESFSPLVTVGNSVELIPEINLKTGLELGYKNFKSSFQYTYISSQFTDAQNTSVNSLARDFGVTGEIPAYSVVDLSTEYTYKKWKLEAGINNLLDEEYFTRRATGYPGPGIIPSAPRSFYAVLQFKF